MKPSRVAKLLGCAAAVAQCTAFKGSFTFPIASSRQYHGRRRAITKMAVDPATVHSVGDYVSVIGNAGLDQAWLSHVLHGE